MNEEIIDQIVALIPDEWLETEAYHSTHEEMRTVYKTFIKTRLQHTELFINEANNARKNLI